MKKIKAGKLTARFLNKLPIGAYVICDNTKYVKAKKSCFIPFRAAYQHTPTGIAFNNGYFHLDNSRLLVESELFSVEVRYA